MPSMRTDALEQGRESTRQRILDAAARLFSHSGYEGTTVKEIARACQLTDPALYYHFPSKREILHALLIDPRFDGMELRFAAEGTREALVGDILDLSARISEHEHVLRLMFRQALDEDADTREFSEGVRESFQRQLAAGIERLYGCRSEQFLEALLSLLAGVHLDALIEFQDDYSTRVSTAEFAGRVRGLVEAALPPPDVEAAV